MKRVIMKISCLFLCLCSIFSAHAQTNKRTLVKEELFKEAKTLFVQKKYAAAKTTLDQFVQVSQNASLLQEAEYMQAVANFKLKDENRVEVLTSYLDRYPDTPYENRVLALMASAYFYEGEYDKSLAMFNSTRLELLDREERDELTYLKAISYLNIGNMQDAAIWFETLKETNSSYQEDAEYYLSYIRYKQQRYDEALNSFENLRSSKKYGKYVPYFIADIALVKGDLVKADREARSYLASYPNQEYAADMHRILGEIAYLKEDFRTAIVELEEYVKQTNTVSRNANYMLGIAYYQTAVYSKAAEQLGEVVGIQDNLAQNAYLHMGLSYLKLAEMNKARMAFEQAAASNANSQVKEQAAYNYALCIHETSFSAFGESVTVFERFLNDYPNSSYAERVSSYLVELYMNTRSYNAALASIERIGNPSAQILEAKQKILFQLGTQAFTNTAFDEAISYLTRSLDLGSYNKQTKANSFYWRGEAKYRLNAKDGAKSDFLSYLQSTLDNQSDMYALAHYNLGYISFEKKAYSEAREWFSKFTRLYRGSDKMALADAYNRIGDTYLRVRNFNDAKNYYARAEELGTAVGDYSFYQLALVSGLEKDYTGKVTLLNRLAGKYPNSPYVTHSTYEKGRSYVLMGNNKQAIAVFKELVAKYPQSPVARKAAAEIGLLYYQDGAHDEAIKAYTHVVKEYPGSEEARLAMRDLKSIYVDVNRVDEFAKLANQLPTGITFDASEQDSLTYIAAEKLYMRGSIGQANESLNRYLQSFPEGAFRLNAHYYLCVIGKQQKNNEMVLEHSSKLLEYPDNPFSEETLVMRADVEYTELNFAGALDSYKKLKEKASTLERKELALIGILRSSYLLKDDVEVIQSATELMGLNKITPEVRNEALYFRAKSYLNQKATTKAMEDFNLLAKDTRHLYGAEAKFQVAQLLYNSKEYNKAEKELLSFIDQSTPHAYWLARGFVLLSDVYVAMGKTLDARQYLLSLQQNYKANDEIADMIATRLNKLNN